MSGDSRELVGTFPNSEAQRELIWTMLARVSALEARERHRVQAMRLLHRWMCGPELQQRDRAELTVAIVKADPDYLPPPEPTPAPHLATRDAAVRREALEEAAKKCDQQAIAWGGHNSGTNAIVCQSCAAAIRALATDATP